MAKKPSTKGFTMIEVMIVLALAGLIVLIVFLAVPSLQRNSRNTQRKSDVALLGSYLNEIVTYNSNQLPSSCINYDSSCWVRDVNLTFYDNQNNATSTNVISFVVASSSTNTMIDELSADASIDPLEGIKIFSNRLCNLTDTGYMTGVGASTQNVVAQYALESRSGFDLGCLQIR